MTIEYTEDAEYAGQKLSGSIVRLNGRPIYIERVYSDGSVYATNFMGHEVQCQLNELDLEPVPLGYINLKRDAIYGQRIPSRYYIQGLRNNNFSALGGRIGIHLHRSRPLYSTIMGVYPKISTCFENLVEKEGLRSIAFSRKFSLKKNGNRVRDLDLMYRNKKVGIVTHGAAGVNYQLKRNKEYLQEALEESINAN